MKMMRLFLLFGIFNICHTVFAQNLMVIHQGNGTKLQIPLESIDSVRFATVPPPIRQKIFQNNGNILSLSVADIDSINYIIPNAQALAGVSTQAVTVLSSSSAYGGGLVSSNGGSAVTQRGLCWSTSPNPTLANNFTVDGTGIGSFGSTMAPLQAATTYYVRAYAVNSEGTAYGNAVVFTTSNPSVSGLLATIATANVVYTSGLTANCGGNITADGGLAVTARGVCWAAGTTPTINNNHTVDGAGAGSFTSTLTNLLPNTTYFVRAYATNDAGTAYGISYAFTTNRLPAITTKPVIGVSKFTATTGGILTDNGGLGYTNIRVCWSTNPLPTWQDFNSGGIGTGTPATGFSFDYTIIGLQPNTTYYVRTAAENSTGRVYGNQFSFTTLPTNIVVKTDSIFYRTAIAAKLAGTVVSDNGDGITSRGMVWSTSPNPTTNLPTKTMNGTGLGYFTSQLSGLSPNTTYYARAYASNAYITAYGAEVSFTTLPASIVVKTDSIFNRTINTAKLAGTVVSDNGAGITSRGMVWSTSPNPTTNEPTKTQDGTGLGYFESQLTGLNPNTTYYARAYASNTYITAYGAEVSFTTLPAIIIVKTDSIFYRTSNTAKLAGTVVSNNGTGITSRGMVWSTSPNPTTNEPTKTQDGTGLGYFESQLSSLSPNTTYYVRAYASNVYITAYGAQITFTTTASVSDIEGNAYSTVKIGTQTWMAENLRVSKYRNGDNIKTSPWASTEGAYSIYNNDAANNNTFGKLYNWYAVADPRGLCPTGWREPSDEDWKTLEFSMGMPVTELDSEGDRGDIQNIGGKLKAPSAGGSNESGFSAFFGGRRSGTDSTFNFLNEYGYWWTTSNYSTEKAWYRRLNGVTGIPGSITRTPGVTFTKAFGLSVRCLKSDLPILTTADVSSQSLTSASGGGNVTFAGTAPVTGRGICWSTSPYPTIDLITKTIDGTGTGSFTSLLTGLNLSVTYYVRAYATNAEGTAYGNQVIFKFVVLAPITTTDVSSITSTTASSGGNITSDGGGAITARGVVWSVSQDPTIALTTKTADGTGIGNFTSSITGLSPSTLYYVRAYATNAAGTAYGNQQTLTTLVNSVFNPNLTYGTVSDNDGNTYKTIVIGTQTWMAENLKTTKYRNGNAIPTNLTVFAWNTATTGAYGVYNNDAANNTTYGKLYNGYAVADSRNLCPVGWHVPTDAEWTTLENYLGGTSVAGGKLKSTSTLWTTPNTGATNESGFSGLPGGSLNGNGYSQLIGSLGYWWSSTEFSPTTAWLWNTYYANGISYRIGGGYRNGFSVRCLKDLSSFSSLMTTIASSITATSASTGGNISADGGTSITARGVCWSTTQNPTIDLTTKTVDGTGTGSFTSSITGLTPGLVYYVRAYATNSVGTAYGNQIAFNTLEQSVFNPNLTYGTMSDNDGNTYKTIVIGTQTWMAENLKTTKYRNGNAIPTNLTDAAWQSATTGAYAVYNNDAANNTTYGKLYNWYAVADSRNLCPTGWHVPSDEEWTTLENFLGGSSVAGGKLKSTSTLWSAPNTGATNENGFSGLSGGFRNYYATYSFIGQLGCWWSFTETPTTDAWNRDLGSNRGNSIRNNVNKQFGFSVRCLRD